MDHNARKTPNRTEFMVMGILLLAAHLYFANEFRAFDNTNVRSRTYLTLAIVDHGSLQIDPCVRRFGPTLDMARSGDHYYTDKAPGYSILLVPLAWILRHTVVAYDDIRMMMILLRVFGLSLFAVAFWLLTWPHFAAWAGNVRRGAAIVIAGALGTSFFIYATQLFSHAAAAMLIFAAYLVGTRFGSLRRSFACGLLIAIAFTFDYLTIPAAIVIPVAAVLTRREARLAGVAALAAGALPVLAAWMAYNHACWGNPLDVGFRHHIDPDYRSAYQRGLWGIQTPNPAAILGMTILPARGILWMSPFLALAPYGFWRASRDPQRRAESITAGLTALGIVLFATTSVDWQGGWCVSARYLVPAIPFLLLGVAAALRQPASQIVTFVFTAGVIVGIVQTALPAATFQHFPHRFHDPYYDMAFQLLRNGHVAGTLWNSAASPWELLPFAVLIVVACVFVLRAVGGALDAHAESLRSWLMPVLAAAIFIGLQLTWSMSLDEPRELALADVMGKMGYTCDSDGLRARVHERAAQAGRGPAYDVLQLAMIRASSPCDRLRDGSQAVALAQQILRRMPEEDAFALDVLGMALAESGRYDDAIHAADHAMQRASPSYQPHIAARRKLYAEHRPYREPLSPR